MMNDSKDNKILIVDDEASILSAYRRNLHGFSKECSIDYVDDSRRALQMLKTGSYDVLVSDVNMPGMDGITLLEEVKQHPLAKCTEVIIVTGLDDVELKRTAIKSGATDLLTKPVLTEDLLVRIRSTLDLKKSRDRLMAHNQELKNQLILTQKMELIGVLAGGAVHDLNNILGVIKGYGQLIQFKNTLEEKVSNDLNTILDSVDRAAAITKQIHTFSRSCGDDSEEVVLNYLLQEIKEILSASIGKHTEINLHLPEFDTYYVNSNPTFLYQVAMNLAINAVQAMEGEGRLDMFLSEKGNFYMMTFQDTGPGIPIENQQKIFEPMFTTKKSTGGSGLGLAIVSQIVSDLGGQISLTSEPGSGAAFTVTLPKAI